MVQPDTALLAGVMALFFAVPALVSAYADRHAPRFAVLAMIAGVALIWYANAGTPGGLTPAVAQEMLLNRVGRLLN